jgi:acetyl-CoA C-acetyltransferase
VGEHWETSLRHLAWEAVRGALQDSGVKRVDGLYVGNWLGGLLSGQEHLGALIADFVGLRGVEAVKVEAAGASGAAALRQAYSAVAGGLMDIAVVVGVEKMTDAVGSPVQAAVTTGADSDYEAAQGVTPVTLAALLMRRYMYEYGLTLADFAPFSVNAHQNGALNPNAMYRNKITVESFTKAPMVAEPINLFDAAPAADGAAALILCPTAIASDYSEKPIRVVASAIATDALALHDRPDPLFLTAANLSAGQAYEQAGIAPENIDVLELHDGYTVLAALTLEATGFARRGEGVRLATDGHIGLKGSIPVSTFGGLKARGDPAGATGVYQAVEVVTQLRGAAGPNQVAGARIGMTQNLGGLAATAVTHIFSSQ